MGASPALRRPKRPARPRRFYFYSAPLRARRRGPYETREMRANALIHMRDAQDCAVLDLLVRRDAPIVARRNCQSSTRSRAAGLRSGRTIRARSSTRRPLPRDAAMSIGGSRTVFTATTTERLRTVRRGQPVVAVNVSSAAVPGSTIPSSSARPSATGSIPSSGTTIWASGSGGRLRLESWRSTVRRR
jgi:hypothetical protein